MRDFHLPGRSTVYASNAMVATSHPLAAKVAVDILSEGGNAVDAAIAGAVLLGVCEPQMTGIGGDCFALVKPAGEERVVGLNGSGRAPAALSADALRAAGHSSMPLYGDPASVSIPGAIDAFARLSADYGRKGLDASLAPAIRYFEEGVPVAPRVASDWAKSVGNLHGHGKAAFTVEGKAPAVGTVFKAPGQAEVLKRIAKDGRDAFYIGEVAEDMVATLQAMGGVHTLEDFAATACDYVEPISGTYRGTELVELPPNGQGATALQMAKMMERFDIASLDPVGAERAHLEAEIAKLAYNARDRFIADPEYVNRLDHVLSDATADALVALINPDTVIASAHDASQAVHKDTIYITVVDQDRMAVSLIYSIFHSFGSGLATEKFGINFQNRGAGFSLTEGHPNEAGGGKRPMHTIIPAMLKEDGRVSMSFGVMGGAYQPNGHARFLSNLVDYQMDLQAALDAPRSFGALGPLDLENGYAPDVWEALRAKGHTVQPPETAIGGAQAIHLGPDGLLTAASDPRKDGIALGF
ncbi:MAG: gamma-glutamyltransferase family protein [Pseudomonadota bacterium]